MSRKLCTTSNIKNPNGILAETLLDALKEDNDATSEKIGALRKKTRDRKRDLAEERRNRALVGMSAFGTLAGSATVDFTEHGRAAAAAASSTVLSAPTNNADSGDDGAVESSETNRSMFASMFPSLLAAPSSQQSRTRASSSGKGGTMNNTTTTTKAQPAWMAEMEAMTDETGATCAVCQEGRTLQPSELLGLYAYLKKVSRWQIMCLSSSGLQYYLCLVSETHVVSECSSMLLLTYSHR